MTTADTTEGTTVPKKTSAVSWTALGLGIVCGLLLLGGFRFILVAQVFAVPALVLAIIGLVQKGRPRAVPIIALVLAGIAILLFIVALAMMGR